jgi:hypothetical protein
MHGYNDTGTLSAGMRSERGLACLSFPNRSLGTRKLERDEK